MSPARLGAPPTGLIPLNDQVPPRGGSLLDQPADLFPACTDVRGESSLVLGAPQPGECRSSTSTGC